MDNLTEQQYIKDRIKVDPNTQCWEWQQKLNGWGYGSCTRHKVGWLVHRLSYTVFTDEISDDLIVRHKCHNPKCCNPDHLESGTHKDNYNDSRSTHDTANKKRRKQWDIAGTMYNTIREAAEKTDLTMHIINKYTDKTTRVFDVVAYREGCAKSNRWTPKV